VSEDPAFATGKPFAQVEDLRVAIGPASLWTRQIQIRAIQLRGAAVHVVQSAGGRWNYESLGGGGEGSTAVDLLEITGARVDITRSGEAAVLENLDLTVRDYAAGKPFRIEAKMAAGGGQVAFSGEQREKNSFSGRLKARNLPFGFVSKSAPAGSVSGELQVTAGSGRLAVQGPMEARLDAGAGIKGQLALKGLPLTATLNGATIDLFGSELQGSLTASRLSPPVLAFDLKARSLNLDEIQKRAAALGGQAAGPSPLRRVHAAGSIEAAQLQVQGATLTEIKARAAVAGGLIRLDPLTANLFGGTHAGSLDIDLRTASPRVALKSRLQGVEANDLLTAFTNTRQGLYGLLGVETDLTLTPQGTETVKSLNGDVALVLTGGRFPALNLMNELAGVGKFLGFRPAGAAGTSITRLAGRFRLKDGVAATSDLSLEVAGASVGGAGQIDLAAQTLDLRLNAILGRELSQQFGGNRVGGFLSTVLAGDRGELIIPLSISGLLLKPKVSPDLPRVAELKARRVLPSTQSITKGLAEALQGNRDGLKRLGGLLGGQTDPPR